MSSSDYVLTTDAEELDRLGFQHRLWSDTASSLWTRAGIGRGSRVLDLGCGPGFASFDLAERVGTTGDVLAIDAAERFLAHLRAQKRARESAGTPLPQLRIEQQDVAALELPPAYFDAVWCRWVLCWVPEPGAAVAAVAAALAPGGCFLVQDYFNYRAMTLAPRWPRFEAILAAIVASWQRGGGNDDFAGTLPALCVEHGLVVESVRPLVHALRGSDPLWDWPGSFWRSFLPHLVATGGLDAETERAFAAEWERRRGDPASFFFTPPVLEFVVRKPR